MKKPAWKRLSSGRYVDLNNLTKEDIDIVDIETALNYTYRFNGHHTNRKPLTVAQHSFLCMELARDFFPENPTMLRKALIHDFAEAYTEDVSTPMKQALGEAYRNWSRPIEELVESVFLQGPITGEEKSQVKLCDLLSLDIERRAMWDNQVGKDKWPMVPFNMGSVATKVKIFESVQGMGYIHLGSLLRALP